MGLRALPFAVLALLSGACVSNNAPPKGDDDSGAFDFDSGTLDTGVPDTAAPDSAGPDGAVTDGGAPDATDAGIDAADAAPPPVTVLVVDFNGVPEPGMTVFFSDPTGALLKTDTTGAAGTVTEVLPGGSQATAIFGTASASAFLTFVAVEPGDSLIAIDPQSAAATFSENVLVTALPPSPPDGGVSFFVNAGSCGSSFSTTSSFSISLASECEAAGRFPLLATASDVNGQPLAFAAKEGVPVALDGGLDDAGYQEVAMEAGSWIPLGTMPVSVTNAPGQGYVFFTLSEVNGYVPYFGETNLNSLTGGAGSVTLPLHPGYSDFVQSEVNFEPSTDSTTIGSTNNGGNVSAIATRSAPSVSSAAFDLSTSLPILTNALVDYSNATRPSVTWTSAAPLTATDGLIASMSWSTEGPSGSWSFVVPPTMTVVQAPVLPAAFSAWGPSSDDGFQNPTVLALEATFWTGYPAFRAGVGLMPTFVQSNAVGTCGQNDVDGQNGPPCIPPLPEDGTLRMSAFTTYEAD